MTNVRLVILFLGVIVLGSLGGIVYLSAASLSIPDVLVATVSGGLGALGAVLAKTSDASPVNVEGPSRVEVDARPDDRGGIDVGTAIVIGILVVLVLVLVGVIR